MKVIKHRFGEHSTLAATETLVIGTFNPDANKNEADFFMED